MTAGRKCIVCGRGIPKRLQTIWFRAPTETRTLQFIGEVQGKPDGTREGSAGMTTLYLADRPRTKEDAARYTNDRILRVRMDGEFLSSATTWDGESYSDKYFCRDKCAVAQGYASAQHGARFVWSERP